MALVALAADRLRGQGKPGVYEIGYPIGTTRSPYDCRGELFSFFLFRLAIGITM